MKSRWRGLLLALFFIVVAGMQAPAQAQAPCPECDVSTRHSVEWCIGGTQRYERGTGGLPGTIYVGENSIDVSEMMTQSCEHYTSSRSNSSILYTWNGTCQANFPDPDISRFDHRIQGGYFSHGILSVVSRSTGQVISSTATSVFTSCGCNDSWGAMLGNDGACYCKDDHVWDDALRTCKAVRTIDRTSLLAPVSSGGSSAPGEMCLAAAASDPAAGNPIYPLRGVKREVLYTGMMVGKLPLVLTYDSTPLTPVAAGGAKPVQAKPPVLGALWSSSLHRKVVRQAGQRGAVVARGDGRNVSFVGSGAGSYTAEVGVQDKLMTSGYINIYTDVQAKLVEIYDTAGNLSTVNWIDGGSLSMTYSTSTTPVTTAPSAGYLIAAQDEQGRITNLTYNAAGRLSTIVDPQNQTTTLAYDLHGNLSTVTWADGKTRTFHYENTAFNQALTGITDERGIRYADFGYDSQGRAISTEYAGGVNRYSASYTTPPQITMSETYDSQYKVLYRTHEWQAPQGIALTDPRGQTSAMGSTLIGGKSYLTSRSQPAGSGCAASTSAMSYDANGNLASRDDFNGNRTCYVHDLTRNLQTVAVEGLAPTTSCSTVTAPGATLPPNARKTTMEWHPNWALPVRISQPGRRTTYVYNNRPDPTASNTTTNCAPSTALVNGNRIAVLCKQVEQATTDADGAQGMSAPLQAGVVAKAYRWTYDEDGRVLSAINPLNVTTTYDYYTDTTADHTLGDLKSQTNGLAQVTNYTKYNKIGQLLEMTDPNNVATVNTYDPRGRLLTTSMGGQALSYGYDDSGQLTRVTQADGAWLGYEYDNARRMKAVVDNQGNRIDYTLDNEGRVTAQEVKDPAGSIARAMSRTLDALGRVQQTTGAP
jgi:YD repeat-containing protein